MSIIDGNKISIKKNERENRCDHVDHLPTNNNFRTNDFSCVFRFEEIAATTNDMVIPINGKLTTFLI